MCIQMYILYHSLVMPVFSRSFHRIEHPLSAGSQLFADEMFFFFSLLKFPFASVFGSYFEARVLKPSEYAL